MTKAVLRPGPRVILCVALLGCHRSGPPLPRVVSVQIADRSPQPTIEPGVLVKQVFDVLRRSGQFEVLEPGSDRPLATDQKSWRCRVEVGAAAERAGDDGMLRAMAQAMCGPTSGEGAETLSAQTLGDKPFGGKEKDVVGLLRGHVSQLVQDTMGLIVRQRRLRVGPLPDLLAALRDPDADVRRLALRAAAARKAREAVPVIVPLLDDTQEDVRDLALGALADIQDPQAVKAITTRVKFSDTDELRKVIDPIAALGGDEARAFLEFVASGHEDPSIRKMAKTALERMDRHRPAP